MFQLILTRLQKFILLFLRVFFYKKCNLSKSHSKLRFLLILTNREGFSSRYLFKLTHTSKIYFKSSIFTILSVLFQAGNNHLSGVTIASFSSPTSSRSST